MTDIGVRNTITTINDNRIMDEESKEWLKALIDKDSTYKLSKYDEESDTGICKCGRVTSAIDGIFYCVYCGQKLKSK
jgi:hypothetical protein